MRFVRGLESVLGPALVALVFACYPSVLRAQTTSASVSGSVQDSQGGVLPGVTVTMTSGTQGNVLTAVTDEGGRFVFPIVRPDTYSLQAALQGFKTLQRTNLIVNANDKLSTGALTLDIGGLQQKRKRNLEYLGDLQRIGFDLEGRLDPSDHGRDTIAGDRLVGLEAAQQGHVLAREADFLFCFP